MALYHFKMCDKDHDQIVHRFGSGCPVCRANKYIRELECQVLDLQDKTSHVIDELFSDDYE